MKVNRKFGLVTFILFLALAGLLYLPACKTGSTGSYTERTPQVSDHFDGLRYFNPDVPQDNPSSPGQAPRRGASWWVWHWIFRADWPAWPEENDFHPGPPPAARVPEGSLIITPVGHATFLIQMDGVNILTDPIWSERCSPLSWVGPKRYREPGIRFEDLPPVDVVLISHNHYDHLDLPTLKRLAEKRVPRSIVPLGNLDLVRGAGIATVDELDWWQSIRLDQGMTITMVPAQHFSSRSLWDRNKTLWGGFVISGPSGNVYYSGDTGYGPHFREIARRFSPIRVALLPIAPFRPVQAKEENPGYRSIVHMGPEEAVMAHLDLNPQVSIAAHFQVFRLGMEGFDDAVKALTSALKEYNLEPDAFVAPVPGRAINLESTSRLSQHAAHRAPYTGPWPSGNRFSGQVNRQERAYQ
jgi:L-ascorbate metabolism protein UlaG (beta-lactamase superfamily)